MGLTSHPMNLYRRDLAPEQWHFGRKLVLLGLLVLALSLGLVILLRRSSNVPIVVFNFFADASLGLVTGLGSRLVLRRRNWFVRALAAAALCIAGLAYLGYLTGLKIGIGPLDLSLVQVHWLDSVHVPLQLPLALGRDTMDLLDLAHVVIAVNTSWMALRAWTRAPESARSGKRIIAGPGESFSATGARSLLSTGQSAQRGGSRIGANAGMLPQRHAAGRPVISLVRAHQTPARGRLRRRQALGRRPEVQLATFAEHRCPYCLEDVKRTDPRGSVECPVCHTLHHQDCWDITGTCQVPHLNA